MARKPVELLRFEPGIVEPAISVDDVVAMVACVEGKANAQQAKHAIDWIMREAARVQDQSFQLGAEDGRRATDFAEGRRYVGHQIRRLLQPETLRQVSNGEDGKPRPPMTQSQAEKIATSR